MQIGGPCRATRPRPPAWVLHGGSGGSLTQRRSLPGRPPCNPGFVGTSGPSSSSSGRGASSSGRRPPPAAPPADIAAAAAAAGGSLAPRNDDPAGVWDRPLGAAQRRITLSEVIDWTINLPWQKAGSWLVVALLASLLKDFFGVGPRPRSVAPGAGLAGPWCMRIRQGGEQLLPTALGASYSL